MDVKKMQVLHIPGIVNCRVYGLRFLKFMMSMISPVFSILILIQSSFSSGSLSNATTLFWPILTLRGSIVKASLWQFLTDDVVSPAVHMGRWHSARPKMSVAIPRTLPTNDWSWLRTTHRRHFLNDGKAVKRNTFYNGTV